jgi:predicted dehydrogenase
MCEKPMCLSLAEADAMIEACERSGTRLSIAHNQRCEARNHAARRLIAEGAIGTPTLLRSGPQGGLLNNGTHAIDLARFVLGDPAGLWVMGQVERRSDRYERGHPIEDRCAGLVGLEGGARMVIESDMPQDWPGGVFVYGTDGALRLGDSSLELLSSDESGWRAIPVSPVPGQHESLLDWVEGGPESPQSARLARGTTEVMMALYESARRRGLVTLPLSPGPSALHQMIDEGTLPVEVPGKYDIRA